MAQNDRTRVHHEDKGAVSAPLRVLEATPAEQRALEVSARLAWLQEHPELIEALTTALILIRWEIASNENWTTWAEQVYGQERWKNFGINERGWIQSAFLTRLEDIREAQRVQRVQRKDQGT